MFSLYVSSEVLAHLRNYYKNNLADGLTDHHLKKRQLKCLSSPKIPYKNQKLALSIVLNFEDSLHICLNTKFKSINYIYNHNHTFHIKKYYINLIPLVREDLKPKVQSISLQDYRLEFFQSI